jgi:hypothetical protein
MEADQPAKSPLIPSVEATFIKCGFTRVIECAYSACIVIPD